MLDHALTLLRSRTSVAPRVAVVLGSGLGGFSSRVCQAVEIPYRDIPGWPVSTVAGHAGKLVLGLVESVPVAVLEGRAHLYEGYSAEQVAFGVRVMAACGVRTLVVTTAAGGINPALPVGRFVLVRDHINLQGASPLTGAQFVDMTDAYSSALRATAARTAARLEMELAEGTYAAVRGPNFETPAEVLFLRAIGADLVGMSMAQEVIAARAAGLEVLGISCVTNVAAGLAPAPITHREVLETGGRAGSVLAELLAAALPRL